MRLKFQIHNNTLLNKYTMQPHDLNLICAEPCSLLMFLGMINNNNYFNLSKF